MRKRKKYDLHTGTVHHSTFLPHTVYLPYTLTFNCKRILNFKLELERKKAPARFLQCIWRLLSYSLKIPLFKKIDTVPKTHTEIKT